MKILERLVQRTNPGQSEALLESDKKYIAAMKKHGFPPTRRYQALAAGTHDLDTYIQEAEWESMAAMEEAYEKWFADPQSEVLNSEVGDIVISMRVELYLVME